MLPSAAAANSGGVSFLNGKKKATAAEIEADYKAVKAARKGMFPPSKYQKFVKLTATPTSLNKELDKRIKVAEADRKAFYPDVAKLPSSVQYALLDMAFNLGRPKLLKYKNLKAALDKKDWKTAAKESKRNGIQPSRNTAISDWILKAK